ncbi:MAG: CpsD/CapB family tyrosine-protein kinase [Clostridia bacterium]|nr:CpsD/CapB family tyrosine-protein kinase [Clostridia bacterium]
MKLNVFSKDKKGAAYSDSSVQNKKIPFAVVESYKAIRANLSFLLSSANNNIVVITSPNSGEGKSTTAVNMAIAFAQLGERVLLIDADMRRSTLHKKLKTENGDGLSNILAGMADLSGCIKQINDNLYFLPSGKIPPNPSELLGSPEFEKLLKTVSPAYSCVIIDTPPMNVVSDTLVAAPHTAGIVMVVRDSRTQNDDIRHVIDAAEFAGIKILGAVINGIKQTGARSYKYKYSSKYYKSHSS